MQEEVFEFLERHSSLVLTTHEGPDADGLGAEIGFSQICREMGKKIRIINAGPTPERFSFVDTNKEIEVWDALREDIPEHSALVILDTSDEYNIGKLKTFISKAAEVFFIDHHEPNAFSSLKGYTDSTSSSTCELIVEIAESAGVKLNLVSASAVYAGIIFDSGSFAYSKTTARTFKAALALLEAGVNPYHIHHELNESASTASLLLQRQVLSTLQILNEGRVAVQIMRKEDLEHSGAYFEDAEAFINIPLKSKDIMASILVKQNPEGQVRCSLRSKAGINVSKIAQSFGGGGHVSAAGFKSKDSIEDTLTKVLAKIDSVMEKK